MDALAKRRAEIREGKFFPDKVRMRRHASFTEIADDYLSFAKANNKDVSHDTGRMRVWKEAFGDRRVDSLLPGDVEQVKAHLVEKHAPATVNRHLIVLRAAYYYAMRTGKVEKNPVARGQVRFMREDNERVRYLADAEREKLFEGCEPENNAFLVAAMNTGIRLRGLTSLLWSDVDLKAGVIAVRSSKSGKTYKVPINSVLRNALTAERDVRLSVLRPKVNGNLTVLPEAQLHEGPVFPRWHRDVRKAEGKGTGKQLHSAQVTRWFALLVKRVGISDLHFHDLRHDFASRQVMAGIPLETVRQLLGHRSLTVVQRYAHLSPQHLHDAVEKAAVGGHFPVRTGTRTGTDGLVKISKNG